FARVARAVAHAELVLGNAEQAARWEAEFHALLTRLEFLPNTPTLMNAGTPLGQLAACFVLPVGDSMEEIFEALKQMALIQRTGGGTGFSFSRLRQRGATLLSTGGTTPGPVAFMKVFDCATENVKLGGRRRGANMGILRVDHPDVLEFIGAKLGGRALRNFNISVGATDAFMEAALTGRTYELRDPRTGAATGTLDAAEVFERIVDAAWRTGDPGLVFLDAMNRANPTPHVGTIEATNPCGEIPLRPYEPCNLGSINLGRMVSGRDGRAALDMAPLRAAVLTGVRVPAAARGPHRGHEPLPRDPAAALRVVQPRLDQPRTHGARAARPNGAGQGEAARDGAHRRPLPRRRHRDRPLPRARDRSDHARQPQDRARRDGLRRPADPARHLLRLR